MSGIIGHMTYAMLGHKAIAKRNLAVARLIQHYQDSYLAGSYLGADIMTLPGGVCPKCNEEFGYGGSAPEKCPDDGTAIVPYQLMILQGSELGTAETIEKYEMEIRSRVLPRAFGSYDILEKKINIADIEDICVASKTLSYEDYLECRQMHLIITIFYNDVVFATVLKALKAQGLSVFRWLELISDATIESQVKGLFKDFREHTDSELWKDRTDLEAFIQNSGVIESYTSGETGFNLLYTFKALAFTKYLDGIVEIVAIAIRRLLKESKRDEDLGLVEFFNSAVCWDAKRMTGILKDMESEVSDSMAYDMSEFLSDVQPKDISFYALPSPVIFKYVSKNAIYKYIRSVY